MTTWLNTKIEGLGGLEVTGSMQTSAWEFISLKALQILATYRALRAVERDMIYVIAVSGKLGVILLRRSSYIPGIPEEFRAGLIRDEKICYK